MLLKIKSIFLLFLAVTFFIPTTIFAGLIFPTDELTIISRSEWGADESLRIMSKKDQEELANQDDEVHADLDEGKDSWIEEFAHELGITQEITTNKKGETLTWPLKYPDKIRKIIIHHTAVTKDLDDPKLAVRNIYKSHTVNRGWGDIGYNFLIDPEGNIYEGRFGGDNVVGGHTGKHNTGSIGISLLGNYDVEDIPYPAFESLLRLAKKLTEKYHLNPNGISSFRGKVVPNIIGHRDLGSTTCPGKFIYEKLPVIRNILASPNLYGSLADQELAIPSDFNFEEILDHHPINLLPNQTEQVTLKLKNTGDIIWNDQTFLITNQADQKIVKFEDKSKIGELLDGPIYPGEIGTFKIVLSSTYYSGLVNLQITPFFNGSEKIEKYLSLPIYVKKIPFKYDFISTNSNNLTLSAGQKITTLVKLKNSSQVTWVKKGENRITLGTDHPRDRKTIFKQTEQTRIGFLKEDQVLPGETGTFELTITAPNENGLFREYFTPVIENVSWLEDKNLFLDLTVQGSPPKAKVLFLDSGTNFYSGENKKIKLQLENVGGKTWGKSEPNEFLIAALKHKSIKIDSFISLPSETKEGENVEITLDITAPEKEGVYAIYFIPKLNMQWLTDKPIYYRFYVRPFKGISSPAKISKDIYNKNIRVALTFNKSNPKVSGSGKFDIYAGDETKLDTLNLGEEAEVKFSDGLYQVKTSTKNYEHQKEIRFIPHSGTILNVINMEKRPAWNPSINDNRFRGNIEIRNYGGKLNVINELPLESYIHGIAETPNSEPVEKLKVMSVISRSYAKYYLEKSAKFPGAPYHLNDDPAVCQKYLGYNFELRGPNYVSAAQQTAGEVVTYNQELVKTPYFNQSDGRTKSAQEIWGWSHTPYLQSVSDNFCSTKNQLGHGVGLSGCGATQLAHQGKTYQEIIKYYYQGVEIKK